MRLAIVFGLLTTIGLSRGTAFADFPYPINPQPCSAPQSPPGCIPATDYSQYLFLPSASPPVRPSDFGGTDWKITSDKSGEADIDSNPQELFGVTGASVDLAWQVSTGRPDVVLAVLDSGIRWQDSLPDVVNKFYLNRHELPVPEGSTNTVDAWDRNGDGVFNIKDYLADATHPQDSRVSDQNGNGVIDPEDLIFLFSDGVDDDGNGYIDDISGWDFFEDDNDPLDEVRYGHGTGEAHDSSAEANNGDSVGTCPNCMVMMVRVGDSFVTDIGAFGVGAVFAVDSGASVIQEALGTINNSTFAQQAVDYAYRHGVVVMASAADEESNHHNYPANLNHTVIVNSVTKYADLAGIVQTPHSYLYLNGCTNYSPHIAVAVPSSSCSSEATGRSSGMAGLLYSAARNEIDRGNLTRYPNGDGSFASFPLSANEVRQLLSTTADDINFDARPDLGLPQNYETSGAFPGVQSMHRYPSIAGYDQYFGYGRVNANSAIRRVAAGKIPPEASIEYPGWFQTLDPNSDHFDLNGRVAANRAASFSYRIEIAPGVQPHEADFQLISELDQQVTPQSGILASIPIAPLVARMPNGVDGPAVDSTGAPDPDRFTFTVRIRVTDNLGNVGEDRRALYLHRDPDLATTTPLFISGDGAASPILADLNNDGINEIVLATADGAVHAYDGISLSELSGWPVHSSPAETHNDSAAFKSGEIPLPIYGSFLAAPSVGDLDNDGNLEVVAADVLGRLYVWDKTGQLRAGFPVKTFPEYSHSWRSERDPSTPEGLVPDRTNRLDQDNRLARTIGASPALGNLDGSADGSLEIVASSADRHVYAWHNDGSLVTGWPVLLKDPTKVASVDPVTNVVTLTSKANARMGTKIIVPPSLGDIDGDGKLDVVIGANEAYSERTNAVFQNLLIQFFMLGGLLDSGNSRLYAIYSDGTTHGSSPIDHGWNPDAFLPTWPAKVALLTTDLLPTVGDGINSPAALADLNHDGKLEIGVFGFIGPAYVFNNDTSSFFGDARPGQAKTLAADTFADGSDSIDTPAYASLGGAVLAEMGGKGTGFQFIAPTTGLGKSVDANIPAEQLPSQNQLAVWDVSNADGSVGSGAFRHGFPHRVNDLQFFTQPSVADITGDGIAEAINGSGVFDFHAVDMNGVEAPGWPKFTGGWTVSTAAIGDIDGDGRVEVVAVTREGYLYIWRTNSPECGNSPSPVYHHDVRSTGNYATDAIPPAALTVQGTTLAPTNVGGLVATLSAIPGDDSYCGSPPTFDFRYSTQPIATGSDFKAATKFTVTSAPAQSSRVRSGMVSMQSQIIQPTETVYVAARTVDAAGNMSPITDLGQVMLVNEGTPTSTATRPIPTATATSPAPTPTATRQPSQTQSQTPTVTPSTTVPPTATGTIAIPPTATRTTTAVPTATKAPAASSESGCNVGTQPSRSLAASLLLPAIVLLRRRQRRRG